MEALTKKTILIEFEGKKYALPVDATMEELFSQFGITEENMVKIKATKDGFVVVSVCNN
jgi:DNA-binding Xre family transcriptional regulator